MEILGFGKKNITILSKKEIVEKAKELAKGDYNKEVFVKLKKQPVPYCLFRYNEMADYDLDFIGCKISEEQYMERLEQLPPVPFKSDIYSGYIVPECITDNLYEHIFRHKGKFYCVIMPCQNEKMMRDWW